jgi:FkbM family methyltransferase
MSNLNFSIWVGRQLYRYAYKLYRPLYFIFKRRQDRTELALLHRIVQPGDTVLDIGANIGFYSTVLSRAVGNTGKVICFEPNEENFRHLQDTTRRLPNVVLHRKAVGAETGSITLYLSDTLNVDNRTYQPTSYKSTEDVDVVNLDRFLFNTPPVDVIKIDIQGFEMEALRGMIQLLSSNENIKILSEFWPYGLKLSGSSATEYMLALQGLRFHVSILIGGRYVPITDTDLQKMDDLGEDVYFNIFASRHV